MRSPALPRMPRTCLSRGWNHLRSLVCSFRSRLVGLRRDAGWPSSFPSRSRRLVVCYRSPDQLRPGSSFLGVPPPQSSFARFSRSASFDPSTPTQGFVPHRGITGTRPPGARFATTSLRSALRLSQPLDGLLRPPAWRACFIPHTTSRVVAVQGLLSPRSRTLSSSAVAPLPFSSRALTGRSRLPHPFASTPRPCSTRGSVLLRGGD